MNPWERSHKSESSSGFDSSILIAALFIAALTVSSPNGLASDDDVQTTQIRAEQSAWALYGANRFVESADAFESVIKSSPPSARLYYYAARANMKANRRARAKQLCYYVVNNFSTTPEAAACKKLFEDNAAKIVAAAGSSSSPPKLLTEETLPADFWANMSYEKKEALKTPAGKLALKKAVDDYNNRMLALWQAGRKRAAASRTNGDSVVKTASATASRTNGDSVVKTASAAESTAERTVRTISTTGTSPHKFTIDNSLRIGAYPFTSADIAKDGSNGIDQSVNPNCWFEASMASLAELPRGQRLLASMIKIGGIGTYVVRFPGDGTEYKITEQVLKERRISDKALWASLIECAQVMKFPNNKGAEGESGDLSRLSVGLGCITGCKAQSLRPSSADAQELSSFIGGAISSKNPIVCATYHASQLAGFEKLVVPQHAYTITDFDPASNLVTIRNPHGTHSDRFFMADDPGHRKFEMKENGVFKMHLTLFQRYFHEVCRSFI